MNLNQCIYCESNNNLNTEFAITLDDSSKVQVKICDKHAEEASVKTAKEAYMKKKTLIDELLSKAKALGLELSTTSSGFTTVSSPKQTPKQNITNIETVDTLTEEDPNVVKTSMLDKQRSFRSVGGDAGGTMVSAHHSIDLSSLEDKLPDALRDGYAQLAIMEGRAGQPITVPQKRIDGTGTTRITIKKSENDDKLQSRFKKMAQDSMHDNIPDFARAGYKDTTRPCPICRGSGLISQQRQQSPCPKCNGSGMISIY